MVVVFYSLFFVALFCVDNVRLFIFIVSESCAYENEIRRIVDLEYYFYKIAQLLYFELF